MANASVKQDRTTPEGRNAKANRKPRRIRLDIETLESVLLLNATLPAPESLLDSESVSLHSPNWTVSNDWDIESPSATAIVSDPESANGYAAWDQVLADHRHQPSSDFLLRSIDDYGESLASSGYGRISTYLDRTWRKAGIAPPMDEDCTQSVYTVLLDRWGRDRFEDVAIEVGRMGLNRLTDRNDLTGLDFLRALDQVKKQAQRQQRKSPASLSELTEPVVKSRYETAESVAIGRDLERFILETLDPREVELVMASIGGDSPSDIAARWGVSPKTVSNIKSEALSKLRSSLATQSEFESN
jgi:DNA-binding CsgD family transcriptional regulator